MAPAQVETDATNWRALRKHQPTYLEVQTAFRVYNMVSKEPGINFYLGLPASSFGGRLKG